MCISDIVADSNLEKFFIYFILHHSCVLHYSSLLSLPQSRSYLCVSLFPCTFPDGDDGDPRGPVWWSIRRAGESGSGRYRAGPSAPEQRANGQQPGPIQCGQEEPAHARNGCYGREQQLLSVIMFVKYKNVGMINPLLEFRVNFRKNLFPSLPSLTPLPSYPCLLT